MKELYKYFLWIGLSSLLIIGLTFLSIVSQFMDILSVFNSKGRLSEKLLMIIVILPPVVAFLSTLLIFYSYYKKDENILNITISFRILAWIFLFIMLTTITVVFVYYISFRNLD